MTQSWRVVAWLVSCLVGLSGCVFLHTFPDSELVGVTKPEIVGTWWNPQRGDIIVFEPNGTFVATNLPHEFFSRFTYNTLPPEFDPERDTLPARGTWRLGPLGESADDPKYLVILEPKSVAGRPDSGSHNLRAESFDGVVMLTYYVGDPDLRNRIRYERCPEQAAAASAGLASPVPLQSPHDPARPGCPTTTE